MVGDFADFRPIAGGSFYGTANHFGAVSVLRTFIQHTWADPSHPTHNCGWLGSVQMIWPCDWENATKPIWFGCACVSPQRIVNWGLR